jgi:hypothetical protein
MLQTRHVVSRDIRDMSNTQATTSQPALETRGRGPHSLCMALSVNSSMRALLASATVLASSCNGCVSDDEAPVAAFEAFYKATVERDVPVVRALLCATERRLLEGAPDALLLQAFSVVKVVKRIELEQRSAAAAVVVVTDAVGQTTRVRLRHDLHAERQWCISGPVPPEEPAAAPNPPPTQPTPPTPASVAPAAPVTP